MRKDYTLAPSTDMDTPEVDFVERYWTAVWQRLGDPHARLSRVTRQPEYAALRRCLPAPSDAVTVVDGGCGMGEWTVCLARKGYRALGLDISRETVETLRRLFPEAAFEACDIREINLAGASVDIYFSWGVFEHFEEGLGRCVAEAWRVLKPGGTLLISVPFYNRRLHWLDRQNPDTSRRPNGARFYQWRLTKKELMGELQTGGFDVRALRPIHIRQGVMRSLHHELKVPYGRMNQLLGAMLAPIAPPGVFAHMLLAVAVKPASDA